MNHDYPPLIAFPHQLDDEAAAKLPEFLYELARVIENHYAGQEIWARRAQQIEVARERRRLARQAARANVQLGENEAPPVTSHVR